ncbi:MAG: hypothetical protein ACXWTL_07790, partial [Methylobacter sp.]
TSQDEKKIIVKIRAVTLQEMRQEMRPKVKNSQIVRHSNIACPILVMLPPGGHDGYTVLY